VEGELDVRGVDLVDPARERRDLLVTVGHVADDGEAVVSGLVAVMIGRRRRGLGGHRRADGSGGKGHGREGGRGEVTKAHEGLLCGERGLRERMLRTVSTRWMKTG